MNTGFPRRGSWFRGPNGSKFEVVAIDEDDGTIELQFFDGTIDEVDVDAWRGMMPVEIDPPEDWSGSVDMDPDDYVGRGPNDMPPGFHDAFEFLDEPK